MQPRRCPHRPTLLKLFQIRWLSRLSVAVSLSLWTMTLDETLSKCVCVCVFVQVQSQPELYWSPDGRGLGRVIFFQLAFRGFVFSW